MPLGLTVEAVAVQRAAWADLAARALEPSVFGDPGFVIPAARYLPRGRRPRFLLAWDPAVPTRLIGLCAVAAPIPGWPVSAWLHPQATAAFPLLDASQADMALANLLAQTAVALRPAGLLLHGVQADGATMRVIAAHSRWHVATLDRRSRAVVRWEPPTLAGKAGKELRRQARRLADCGAVAVTTASDPVAALETFMQLEAAGWKGARTSALAQRAGSARFARAMVAALAQDGRCQIESLELDARPIAMGLVLRSGGHAFFWKTAFDESFARFSPGAQLAAAIGQAQARDPGVELTDSCAVPGHSMIDRLWPERTTVVDAFVTPAPNLRYRGRAALSIERGWRRCRDALKRARAEISRYAAASPRS